jgi:hypothetical protein
LSRTISRLGSSTPSRYEPDLNPTYQDLAEHYGIAVIPARPYKPKDKAKAEVGVQVVERWILARLRNRTFFSLADLNRAVRELLDQINARPMEHLERSRCELFEELDKPALRPLPEQPYEFATWKKATVNIDYHVEFEKHYRCSCMSNRKAGDAQVGSRLASGPSISESMMSRQTTTTARSPVFCGG